MSTNYYVHTADGTEIHLGKWSTGGFTFQAIPERDVMSYDAWLRLLDLGEIRAESGYTLTPDEMIEHANEQVPPLHRSIKLGYTHRSDLHFIEDGRLFTTQDFC